MKHVIPDGPATAPEKTSRERRYLSVFLLICGLSLSYAITRYSLVDQYLQLVLMYIGINIILALSLNLVNGYMGEFSVGHAGFMSIGAYVSSLITVKAFLCCLQSCCFRRPLSPGGSVRLCAA